MAQKKCASCGGTLRYTGADSQNAYYECPHCSEQVIFAIESEGGVNLVFETRKKELLARLRRGFDDWRAINWDQLYKDIVEFISAHEQLQNDIRFQMAIVACLTKGFHAMDAEKSRQCKILIKGIDKMYKQQTKELKQKIKNPALVESVGEYEAIREKYAKLQSDYANGRLPWNMLT